MKINLKTFLFSGVLFCICIEGFYPRMCIGQVELFSHLYGGYSHHRPTEMKLNLNGEYYEISNVRFSSQSLRLPIYYGISAGISVSKKFPLCLSIEFIHDKAYVRESKAVQITKSTDPDRPAGHTMHFSDIMNKFSMSHGFNFILIKISYPLKSGSIWNNKYAIYMGLAAGGMLPHVESKNDNQTREKYEFHKLSGMVDLYSEYTFYKNMFLVTGIKYTYAGINDAGIVKGNLSTHIHSWHFVIGLGFRLSLS